jgi:TIR domain
VAAPDDIWTFISYAHGDDLTTSASGGQVGFVSFLDHMLERKLRDLGAPWAKLWMDRRRIVEGDQFNPAVDEGLRKAQILIVVLSNNWMGQDYCRRELDAFVECRRADGVERAEERIIVVGKGHVDRQKRPPILQSQEGFLFYSRDGGNDVTQITPFFNRGKATTDLFFERRDDLALYLQKRVERIATSTAPGIAATTRQVLGSMGATEAPDHVTIVSLAKPTPTATPHREPEEKLLLARRWYVSYAWADEDDPTREARVDALCEDATKRGVEIIRDKSSLGAGDLISEFMRKIGEGDRVFIFLSEKYLHSPYGLFELFEMWRNCAENRSEFLRRVRLFTLDGTKIGEPEEWLAYTDYWKQKRENLRGAINRVGWEDAGEEAIKRFWLMDKFTGKISDVLALFADVVRPRSFEDFLKYGFDESPPARP